MSWGVILLILGWLAIVIGPSVAMITWAMSSAGRLGNPLWHSYAILGAAGLWFFFWFLVGIKVIIDSSTP